MQETDAPQMTEASTFPPCSDQAMKRFTKPMYAELEKKGENRNDLKKMKRSTTPLRLTYHLADQEGQEMTR